MDNLISFLIAAFLSSAFLLYYLRQEKKRPRKPARLRKKGNCVRTAHGLSTLTLTTPTASGALLARW
jgi:hypothetical protein